jgi:pimeloyl-ACP methyl ester carboxylesterase
MIPSPRKILMNPKTLFVVAALAMLSFTQLSFGQVVCFIDVDYVNVSWDANNCPITVAEGAGGYTSIQVVLYPNTGGSGGYSLSGTLSGDLGAVQYSNPKVAPPVLTFPCQTVSADEYPMLSAVTVYSPGAHLVTATITGCYGYPGTWTANLAFSVSPPPPPTPTPCSVSYPLMIDPVASNLLGGSGVTQNASAVASAANPSYVSGAAADGVTQVIVEVPTGQPGDSVQLTLLNENGQQDSVANDGGLFPLVGGSPGSAASSLTLQAQATSGSPMALAVWRAPANYYRGTQDATTVERHLTLQAQCTNAAGAPATVSQGISTTRPPVLLVHGLWGSPSDWHNFSPTVQNNLDMWNILDQERANYKLAVSGVTSTSPSYNSPPAVYYQNAFGFAYNAPTILSATQHLLADYERNYGVAAVQADVVAHSMGGNIVRVMPTLTTGPAPFASQSNYGLGPVHKLITIGTPHQGTPLAVDLLPSGLGDPNICFRNTLEINDLPSFQTVTIGGSIVNGAVADLGTAPANLPATEPFPMAYIAGSTNAANLQNLDSTPSVSELLRLGCLYITIGPPSPLAYDLTPALWNNVFSAANDAVVPLSSQLNNTTSTPTNTFQGVIHSPGIEILNFSPPSEVDSQSGIPDAVVNLLNEATNGPDFH